MFFFGISHIANRRSGWSNETSTFVQQSNFFCTFFSSSRLEKLVSRGLRLAPLPRSGNLPCCGRSYRYCSCTLISRPLLGMFFFNLLCLRRLQAARVVPQSDQNQEKMVLEVTSDVHERPLVPKMGPRQNIYIYIYIYIYHFRLSRHLFWDLF